MSQSFQNLYSQVAHSVGTTTISPTVLNNNSQPVTTTTAGHVPIGQVPYTTSWGHHNVFNKPYKPRRKDIMPPEVWGKIEKLLNNINRNIDRILFKHMFKFKSIKLKRVVVMNEITVQIKYGFLPWRCGLYFCDKIKQMGDESYYDMEDILYTGGMGIGPEKKINPTIEEETQEMFKEILDAYLNVKKNRYVELDEIDLNKAEDQFRLKL